MASYTPRHRPKPSKWCQCGSGLKFKNCCGRKKAISPTTSNLNLPLMGVPGEQQKLVVVNQFKGNDVRNLGGPGGLPGTYIVQMLLSKPGRPLSEENHYDFIDNLIGTSHLRIAKPSSVRRDEDVHKVVIQTVYTDLSAKNHQYSFEGIPNDEGFLGKLTCEKIEATDSHDAEVRAYGSIAPFLSAWSLHLDIPVNVESTQVTELRTGNSTLRILAPFLDMHLGTSQLPFLTDDYCHYASIYREGLCSNSPFYKFLCFYKIIEGIDKRRARLGSEAKSQGKEIRKPHIQEKVLTTEAPLLEMLSKVYPWRTGWDSMSIEQIFPKTCRGKNLSQIRQAEFDGIRNDIAHALWEGGEVRISIDRLETISKVNLWLPLARFFARLVLKNEFPEQFGSGLL